MINIKLELSYYIVFKASIDDHCCKECVSRLDKATTIQTEEDRAGSKTYLCFELPKESIEKIINYLKEDIKEFTKIEDLENVDTNNLNEDEASFYYSSIGAIKILEEGIKEDGNNRKNNS